MSEKVASHSGVTRHIDASSSATPANVPGRLIANRIFVGNIPSNLVERDLMMLFNRFGKIRDVKIIPEHTRNKSYGFVTFFSEADARRAIQASVQHDSVMWGDRKLNVAPAIKRNNHSSSSPNLSGHSPSPRIVNNSFYAAPLPIPGASMYSNPSGIVAPAEVHQPQTIDRISTDPSNNAVFQTALICRLPQQYAMAPCQYSPATNGHYFVTPGFQPYIQTGSPIPPGNHGSNYTSYASSVASLPLTPPCSVTSRDNSVVADTQPDHCADSNGGDSAVGSQGENEKAVVEILSHEANTENGQHQHPSGGIESSYPVHTTIMCCPHHSCMLSPISPVQHLPSQAVAAAGLARSCMSLHGHPATNCPYPPSSPVIYSSPIMYSTARRSSARLQRWNSLDASLTGIGHGHHSGHWSNETTFSRPSLLDDSYGSEAGLYADLRGFDRPLRPAFSCQSHHGMFSPFCRSYEYNIWGQGQAPNSTNVDHVDSGSHTSTSNSQLGTPVQSHSNLALNLNEVPNEQIPHQHKK